MTSINATRLRRASVYTLEHSLRMLWLFQTAKALARAKAKAITYSGEVKCSHAENSAGRRVSWEGLSDRDGGRVSKTASRRFMRTRPRHPSSRLSCFLHDCAWLFFAPYPELRQCKVPHEGESSCQHYGHQVIELHNIEEEMH